MWVMRILLLALNLLGVVLAEPQVPCFFIFGDSLADPGNNNPLRTLAKVNYPPYGIDFPYGPTGRFTNGRTMVDFITQFLGFDHFIPPYASLRGRVILTGVSYASGSSGIRDQSGQQVGARISLSNQLENHRSYIEQLKNYTGDDVAVAKYLSKCLYSVGMGSNDYDNNYFLPQFSPTSMQYTPEQYATVLFQQYWDQLRTLYQDGARKVVVWGVAQLGCTPTSLAQNNGSCNNHINIAVELFNLKLPTLVDDFNKNFPGAKFIFVNSFGISLDIVLHHESYGFTVINAACCGSGKNNGEYPCLPFQTPCQNRSQYLFWDQDHPTEAFNVLSARRAYIAQSPSDTYPIDIKRLVQLSGDGDDVPYISNTY